MITHGVNVASLPSVPPGCKPCISMPTAGGRSAFDTPANYCFGSQRRCRHCSDVFFGGQEERKKKVTRWCNIGVLGKRGQSGRRQICSSWPETQKTGTVSKKSLHALGLQEWMLRVVPTVRGHDDHLDYRQMVKQRCLRRIAEGVFGSTRLGPTMTWTAQVARLARCDRAGRAPALLVRAFFFFPCVPDSPSCVSSCNSILTLEKKDVCVRSTRRSRRNSRSRRRCSVHRVRRMAFAVWRWPNGYRIVQLRPRRNCHRTRR